MASIRPSQPLTQYQYEALNPDYPSIRLLSIDSERLDQIDCSLQAYDFSKAPPYIALSYTWGPPEPTEPIIVNGQPLAARQNLLAALKAIRSRGIPEQIQPTTQYIWIDAACINQNDIPERNRQVGMMGEIYSKAQCILAWLGEADSYYSNEIMDLAYEVETPQHPDVEKMINKANIIFKKSWDQFLAGFPGGFDISKSIFGRDYWSRVWIIQENILAREIVFMCGEKTCRWEELSRVLDLFKTDVANANRDPLGAKPITVVFMHRASRRMIDATSEGAPPELLALYKETLIDYLMQFWNQKCFDPRDKIFGLLGIERNTPAGVRRVTADYNKSVTEVLEDVLRYIQEVDAVQKTWQVADSDKREFFVVALASKMGLTPQLVLDNQAVHFFLGGEPRNPEWWSHPADAFNQ